MPDDANQGERVALLAGVRTGYLAAVRKWSRDALLLGSGLFLAGAFLVVPYATQAEQLGVLEQRSASVELRGARLQTLVDGLESIAAVEQRLMRELSSDGTRLAGELTTRLQHLGNAVRGLREGGLEGESFPGASMAEQFQLPTGSEPPGEVTDPVGTLALDYGLTGAEIELLAGDFAAGPEGPDYLAARQLVGRLFTEGVNAMYARLEQRTELALGELRDEVERTLPELAETAQALGVELPDAGQLVPDRPPITPPLLETSDFEGPLRVPLRSRPAPDHPFPTALRTVDGKVEAMAVETGRVAVETGRATAPLHELRGVALFEGSQLDDALVELQGSRAVLATELDALASQMEAAAEQLGDLTVATAWMPLHARDLVRLFPLLVALAFLYLTLRFDRTRDLRQRLERGYRDSGVQPDDVELLFFAAEASFDPFHRTRHGMGVVPRVAALGFAALLVALFATVPSGWLCDGPAALFSSALAGLVGVLACVAVLRLGRPPALRD